MCTVSWIDEPGGYQLFCNRDEKKGRAPALAPRIDQLGGVRFVAPVDAEFGGSWIGVNEYGVSTCLLNSANVSDRPAFTPSGPLRSRGLVVRDLVTAASASECGYRLSQLDLIRVAPFTVLFLEPGASATVGEWNGEALVIIGSADGYMPITSSSYDPAGVREKRLREFHTLAASAGRIDAALLCVFHSSHGSRAGAYSTCMHRPDAETVSFSHVVVRPDGIRFSYWPASPCKFAAREERMLLRAA